MEEFPLRKLLILMKILVPVLGVTAFLVVRHIAQDTGRNTSRSSAGETRALPETDSTPPCSGDLHDTLPVQASSGGRNRHSVTLSWNPSLPTSNLLRDSIKGYYVYRSQTSQTYTEKNRINSLPLVGTRCLDTAVEPRATYYYSVKAVTENGALSAVSREIKAVIPFP
jgi:hypothetical protein